MVSILPSVDLLKNTEMNFLFAYFHFLGRTPYNYVINISSIVIEKIDDVSEIDYTLLSAPVCTADYVETNHKVLCL